MRHFEKNFVEHAVPLKILENDLLGAVIVAKLLSQMKI